MSNKTNELLANKLVALRIAIPGEAVSQHNGRIVDINDSTITIVNTVDDSADFIVTAYNWKYVILVQYLQSAEPAAVESEEATTTTTGNKKAK